MFQFGSYIPFSNPFQGVVCLSVSLRPKGGDMLNTEIIENVVILVEPIDYQQNHRGIRVLPQMAL